MRILVTGGAGYIGSHVVRELMDTRNFEIVVVDTMDKGNTINLFPENEFIQGEIQNPEVLKKVFSKKIDAVFHFAAWKAAGESMTDPVKYSLNNINGTLRLLAAMVDHGTQNIIFSSSAAVYGAPVYLPIDEKHPLNPENYYGYTKLAIEENLRWYDKLKGIKYAALRYFNAAGYHPRGLVRGLEKTPANLLPIVMEVVVGKLPSFGLFGEDYDTPDGSCIRDYIHVSDLASAHVLSLDYLIQKKESLIVNLGSENGYSVKEIISYTEKIIGKKLNYTLEGRRAGDPAKLLAASAKAREILHWEPKFSSAESIIQSMWTVYKD